MFAVKAKRRKTAADLVVSGELVFENVKEFAEVFRTVLDKPRIVLDHAGLDRVDLAGLQVLFAAQSGSSRLGYELELKLGENAARIEKITRFAGLRMLQESSTNES